MPKEYQLIHDTVYRVDPITQVFCRDGSPDIIGKKLHRIARFEGKPDAQQYLAFLQSLEK